MSYTLPQDHITKEIKRLMDVLNESNQMLCDYWDTQLEDETIWNESTLMELYDDVETLIN